MCGEAPTPPLHPFPMPGPSTLRPAASSRRDFFKRAGLGLGAVAAASALQACDTGDPEVDAEAVRLDFASDAGVLNYAYALEQLEAAFYAAVVADSRFATTFSGAEQVILRDLAAHEAIHRDFLAAAIAGAGAAPIRDLTPDFGDVELDNRDSVLATALVFEDLGVSAYNGAGRYLDNGTFLTIAGKIVSVEARHASVVAGLITPNAIAGADAIDGMGLDKARTPTDVLRLAAPFIEDDIVAVNV